MKLTKQLTMVVVVGVFAIGATIAPATTQAMNKAELIEAMASQAGGDPSGLSKADAKKALEGFTSATTKALKKGDRLSLIGFGSFGISNRSARTGRNPQSNNDERTVEFFNEVREMGASNRHQGETSTLVDIQRDVAQALCPGDVEVEGAEKCEPGEKEQEAGRLLAALFSTIFSEVAAGEEVSLGETFGVFYPPMLSRVGQTKISHKERNPQTGKEIQIAAKNSLKFKAGAELSKSVN
jgi:nucleoid DNA-binding protein